LNRHGVGVVSFLNESAEKHHGITWFNSKENFLMLIDAAGLRIVDFRKVRPTVWHYIIKKWLWDLPKSLIFHRDKDYLPQTFEQTEAFQIIKNGESIKTKLFTYYAKIATRIARLLPSYDYFEVGEEINNKILLMRLQLK